MIINWEPQILNILKGHMKWEFVLDFVMGFKEESAVETLNMP